MIIKGWHKEDLCGNGIALYLACGGAYGNHHIWLNDMVLSMHTSVDLLVLTLCYSYM